MVASITDHFSKASDGNGNYPATGVVSAERTAGDSVLTCADLSGWATDTAVHFSTYRLDTSGAINPASQTDWKGVVSGNTISNLTRLAGAADTGNAVGDIVQLNPTIGWLEDLINGILVSHDQSGALKSGIIGSTQLASGAVTSAKISSSAVTSAKIGPSAVTADKIASGAITADKLDTSSMSTAFYYKKDESPCTVSFTTTTACIIEAIAVTSYKWGYSGGTMSLDITTSNVTSLLNRSGNLVGGDGSGKQMTAIFLGRASANKTVTIRAIQSGNAGGAPDFDIGLIVRCHRLATA